MRLTYYAVHPLRQLPVRLLVPHQTHVVDRGVVYRIDVEALDRDGQVACPGLRGGFVFRDREAATMKIG